MAKGVKSTSFHVDQGQSTTGNDASCVWAPAQKTRGCPYNFPALLLAAQNMTQMRLDLHRFRSGQVLILGGSLFEGHGSFPFDG